MANDTLELSPGRFYGALTDDEYRRVEQLRQHVHAYMVGLQPGHYLIAGVGGILRREDPSSARDIDLAVVGLKYGKIGEHGWNAVEAFSRTVRDYFQRSLLNMLHEEGFTGKDLTVGDGSDGDSFLEGSGPFGDWKYGFMGEKKGLYVRADVDLESFGRYNSKGLQVRFRGMRPIDIQFVFNRTPEEWRADQQANAWPYAVFVENQ